MRFVCLLLLLALPVLAQPRKASAFGNTKDDDEPASPQPSAPAAECAGADVALLRGLLFATEPNPLEVRVQAIEDLGLLGDARALNPLAQLVFDPNARVWSAALRAIGAIRHPRAEEILSNIIRHPQLAEAQKLKALEYLPFQNTPSAIRFIASVQRTTTLPSGVQNLGRRIMLEIPLARGGTQ
ncbi:MAG: HEAT repeat domain-containing protein [Myxococcus sp.]|nr:HEAT repeat domain-containing protein [Myxococcus sp.]